LKWLVPSFLVFSVGVATSFGGFQNSLLSQMVLGLGALLVPITIGIAILRFRLFEIDRIVSRTVTYLLLVSVLAALYSLVVALPTSALGADTPSWVVAASTLAAAALFSPLRRVVQRMVDRRFNRSRYDAERVVERFASHVREFTDVATITSGLSSAVSGALHPSAVAVWWYSP
jgi:hypothetical protein